MFSLWAATPFVGLLLSISLLPLWFKKFWHRYQNHLILFWGVLACAFILSTLSFSEGISVIGHELYGDYFPFILTIAALYIIATGISIRVHFMPTPQVLTGILAFGAVLANFLGTMGASVVLISPFLEIIKQRKHKSHILVFFILLVSNCGGSLSPLGDPPLFMGFLYGIPFLWFLQNLWPIYLVTCGLLLLMFFALDHYYVRKEPKLLRYAAKKSQIHGAENFVLLTFVIIVVFLTGSLKDAHLIFPEWVVSLVAKCVIFGLIGVSLFNRPKKVHWEPIVEVAKIFIVIFIALIPVNMIIEHGTQDIVKDMRSFVNPWGRADPLRYFWISGILSGFLDNAPTFAVFYKMALDQMTPVVLRAISFGTISMGALTYIGNAPNLLVRSMAEMQSIKMPSFIGYMGYSFVILMPVLMVVSFIFFT